MYTSTLALLHNSQCSCIKEWRIELEKYNGTSIERDDSLDALEMTRLPK
jgi:hypothetical protein